MLSKTMNPRSIELTGVDKNEDPYIKAAQVSSALLNKLQMDPTPAPHIEQKVSESLLAYAILETKHSPHRFTRLLKMCQRHSTKQGIINREEATGILTAFTIRCIANNKIPFHLLFRLFIALNIKSDALQQAASESLARENCEQSMTLFA